MAKSPKSQIAIIEQGKKAEFWKLICEFIDKSVKIIEKQRDSDELQEFPADRYKFEMELLKTKIQYLKRLKDYPDTIIGSLEEPEFSEENLDPYEGADDSN